MGITNRRITRILLTAFVLVTTFTGADGNAFETTSYPTGQNSYRVAVADFDRDGTGDLAVANNSSSDVTILLGNVDGTFRPGVNYATQSFPLGMAKGDFNDDSKVDLIITNIDDTADLFLGNGDGTLRAPVNFAVGGYPYSVVAEDFDGDGESDLAVGNRLGNGVVSIFPGQGDGSFRAGTPYATARFPNAIASGDFDGDAKPDLAVTCNDVNQGRRSVVSVLLNNGDGTLRPPVKYATAPLPDSVAVADFNRDGVLDLVTGADRSAVSVLLGNGDGTFRRHADFAAGESVIAVAVGDLNRDRRKDIVAACALTQICVLAGRGDGTFGPALRFDAGGIPDSLALGDFNHDGKQDIAAANYEFHGTVTVLLNTGNPLAKPSTP